MDQDPLDTPLPVAAAGDGWVVVDKPAGVSVHNDPGVDLCTSVQRLLAADRQLAAKTGFAGGDIHAPHRLDRDTSGLVLLCCQASALAFYGAAFQARRVGKCYLAVLHGRLDTAAGAGEWAFALARSGAGRMHPAGPRGQWVPCRTVFRVLLHSDHYTLVACTPLTGRPHQIRRHAKLAGHPVVGDRRYGSTRSLRYLKERAGFARLGLHAYGLDLPRPDRTDRQVVLSGSPPRAILQLLGRDGGPSEAAVADTLGELADPRRWPGHSAHP